MPPPRHELSADEIVDLLTTLGARLQARGVHASLYVVGGAAIALALDTRRVTADVDAVFAPVDVVEEEAAAIAEAAGLPAGWLSRAAAAFVPGADAGATLLDVPGLAVSLASPEHLLAMKMAAYRPGKDQTDLELLFAALGISTPDQAAHLAEQVYGSYTEPLPSHDELVLSARAILERMAAHRAKGHRRLR